MGVVTSDHMAALRAIIAADEAAYERLTASTSEEELRPLAALITMAFATAARSRFAAGWTDADLIRLIARMRTKYGTEYDDYSPALAEDLLAAALENKHPSVTASEELRAATQMVLLRVLTDDIGEQEFEQVLATARERADRWLLARSA